jgi:hypothetical protein
MNEFCDLIFYTIVIGAVIFISIFAIGFVVHLVRYDKDE